MIAPVGIPAARQVLAAVAALIMVAPGLARATPAGDRYALVVTGAAGGEVYARQYDAWRVAFITTLREKLAYPDDHVAVLADPASAATAARSATREQVRRVLGDWRNRLTKDDQLFVLLIGHGTSFGDDDAKFNLVGPDLSASEWADLLKAMPGTLVFVDATAGGFPFLRRLAGRGRVVLTATDSVAQQFETVFPQFFVKAFDDPAADADKNGRVSVWEAFVYASAGVRQWFDQRGHLPTERARLDDTGAGIGREAQNPGTDGALARATYLEPPGAAAGTTDSADAALGVLLKRRIDLEAQIDALRAGKDGMPADQYEAALERLLLELARVARQIRTKS